MNDGRSQDKNHTHEEIKTKTKHDNLLNYNVARQYRTLTLKIVEIQMFQVS